MTLITLNFENSPSTNSSKCFHDELGDCNILVHVTKIKILFTDTEWEPAPQDLINLRQLRQEQLQVTAERVQESYQFKTSISKKSFETDLARLNNEGVFPELELGFIRLSEGVFNSDKVVVWLGALNCGFSLICDCTDNRVTAEAVLKLLVKYMQEHCQAFNQPTEILSKVDRVTAVVEQFLPGGQLCIMNHRVVRQLEKELDVKLKNM